MCVWGCHLIFEAGGCSSFPCDRDCIPDILEPSIWKIYEHITINIDPVTLIWKDLAYGWGLLVYRI